MLAGLGLATPLKAGLAAVALAGLAWLAHDYAWRGAELERQRGLLAEAVAANESLVAAAAALQAHHAAVVAALEAAAANEAASRAETESLLQELRHAPEDDRPLSAAAQRFFERLRGGP